AGGGQTCESRLQVGAHVVGDPLAIDQLAHWDSTGSEKRPRRKSLERSGRRGVRHVTAHRRIVRRCCQTKTLRRRSTKTLKTGSVVWLRGCTLATGLASSRNVSERSSRSSWRTKSIGTATQRSRSWRP